MLRIPAVPTLAAAFAIQISGHLAWSQVVPLISNLNRTSRDQDPGKVFNLAERRS